jgi:hypothetical protein
MKRSSLLAAIIAGISAAGCDDYTVCDEVPGERLTAVPERLSQTGLYADIQAGTLGLGVRPFTPRFQLWSDGAAKRRFIRIPSGQQIDSTDPDFWQFPVGTQLWKEFTRDGVKVETRLLQRVGPGARDWATMAYVWNDNDSDAIAAPDGASDVRGTPHDVPSAARCAGCHGGTASRVLGFSAIQLSRSDTPGGLTLSDLTLEDLLTVSPAAPYELPGSALDQEALGYLHANCGHCHNASRPAREGSRCFDPQRPFDFLLRTGALSSVFETPALTTAHDVINPGDSRDSGLVHIIDGGIMPPLARERVDVEGLDTLRAWIDQL